MSVAVGCKYWQNVDLSASPVLGPALRCPYNGHLWGDFTWTGTPTGTFAIQVRTAGGPWNDVSGAAAGWSTQPAGAAGTALINLVNLPGDEFRITYTGAGAGSVNGNVGFGDVQEA